MHYDNVNSPLSIVASTLFVVQNYTVFISASELLNM